MRYRRSSSSLLLATLLICGAFTAHPALAASEYDETPVPVKSVSPAYPEEMRKEKASGIVTVKVLVDENGDVVERAVAKSSRPEFESAALEAVGHWKFKPAKKGGVAVKCRITIPIKFNGAG